MEYFLPNHNVNVIIIYKCSLFSSLFCVHRHPLDLSPLQQFLCEPLAIVPPAIEEHQDNSHIVSYKLFYTSWFSTNVLSVYFIISYPCFEFNLAKFSHNEVTEAKCEFWQHHLSGYAARETLMSAIIHLNKCCWDIVTPCIYFHTVFYIILYVQHNTSWVHL
jgi:hypothetical protein